MKREMNMMIANTASDIMNYKLFSKTKTALIALYNDRESFYGNIKADFDEDSVRLGITDRKSYGKLCSVLSSYNDEYTLNEIVSCFQSAFYDGMNNLIVMNKLGKKKNLRLEIGFAEEPDGPLLAKLLSFYEYMTDVCGVNVVSNIASGAENFALKKFPPDAKFVYPDGLIEDVKHLCMNNILFLDKYKTSSTGAIEEADDDKVLISKFSCDTRFYDACFYGMQGLFDPSFYENSLAIDMLKSCFDMSTEDFAMTGTLLSAFSKFDVDIVPKKSVVDGFKSGGYNDEEVERIGVYACMRSCFARSMLGTYKYSDDLRLIYGTGLTKQEIRRIIASTYLWAENMGISMPTHPENTPKCSLLINDMVQNGIGLLIKKNRKNALISAYNSQKRNEKAAAKSETKKSKESSNLERVLEENKRLQTSLNQVKADLKTKKDIEKSVRGEMAEMRKGFETKLKELEEELEKTKTENSDLQSQLDDAEFVSDDDSEITKEDILKAAEGKTVLVWGIRTEIAERLVAEYGEVVNCIATDDYQNGLLPSGAVDKCDAAIIVTNYSSHSRYWKARDEIKASGVPYAHLRRNINSPERIGRLIWKVLTSEENRNLD